MSEQGNVLVKVILTCSYPGSLAMQMRELLVASRLVRAVDSAPEIFDSETAQSGHEGGAGTGVRGPCSVGQKSPDEAYRDLALGILSSESADCTLGLAGSQLLWLVDYWTGIEEQARFIFVYSRPEDTLAELLGNTEAGKEQLEDAVSNWTAYYTEAFRCYFQNPGKCLLVHADAIREPSAFVGRVIQLLELPDRDNPPLRSRVQSEDSAIYQVLTRAAIGACQFRVDLYDELESSADLPGTSSPPQGWLLCKQARKEYTALLTQKEHDSARWRADQFALEDLASVGATLKAELVEQRIATESWKRRAEDLQSIEAALTAEQSERHIQLGYWKQLASEFEALSKERAARLKICEAGVLRLSGKLAEDEVRLDRAIAESARLRAQGLELGKECELVTQQWLKAEEGIDRQSLMINVMNESAAASIAVKEQQLESLRQNRREIDNNCAISDAEVAHLQRELEYALNQCSILSMGGAQETSDPASEVALQPTEFACDFREHIDGDNWYDAEHDGRWAGPHRVSAVRLPRLRAGDYHFEIEVVDAMDPQFISELELLLNGERIEFVRGKGWKRYPAILKGQFSTSTIPERDSWELQFAFPGLASPAENGSDDKRLLAVRVRGLKVVLLQAAAALN
jgi:hypothetical protein